MVSLLPHLQQEEVSFPAGILHCRFLTVLYFSGTNCAEPLCVQFDCQQILKRDLRVSNLVKVCVKRSQILNFRNYQRMVWAFVEHNFIRQLLLNFGSSKNSTMAWKLAFKKYWLRCPHHLPGAIPNWVSIYSFPVALRFTTVKWIHCPVMTNIFIVIYLTFLNDETEWLNEWLNDNDLMTCLILFK